MCTQFLACHSETHWLAAFLFFQTTENFPSPNGWAQCLAQSLAQIRLSQNWVKAHRTTPWTWTNFPCLENTQSCTPCDGPAQHCCFSPVQLFTPCWYAQCKINTFIYLFASVKIFNVPKGPCAKRFTCQTVVLLGDYRTAPGGGVNRRKLGDQKCVPEDNIKTLVPCWLILFPGHQKVSSFSLSPDMMFCLTMGPKTKAKKSWTDISEAMSLINLPSSK